MLSLFLFSVHTRKMNAAIIEHFVVQVRSAMHVRQASIALYCLTLQE